MTLLDRQFVTCPNCSQQFEGEIDGEDCVFEIVYCGHEVCISCSFDHIETCKAYWLTRRFGG